MSEDQEQPIIVVKKKGGHGGHHGGAWKVAYADFVTAMMAFFLVMWLVSQDQIVKDNIQAWFQDPAGYGKQKAGDALLKGGASVLGQKAPMVSEAIAREILKKAGEKIRGTLEAMPEFETIKDHVEINLTEEGLRIELIESISADDKDAYFFESGSAELSDRGVIILSAITREIAKLNNKVIIEGHTDGQKFNDRDGYSNWELSADRANSARKLMVGSGLKPDQVSGIRGYAATAPRYPDNPLDHRNRRISIIILTTSMNEIIEYHEVINGTVIKEVGSR